MMMVVVLDQQCGSPTVSSYEVLVTDLTKQFREEAPRAPCGGLE